MLRTLCLALLVLSACGDKKPADKPADSPKAAPATPATPAATPGTPATPATPVAPAVPAKKPEERLPQSITNLFTEPKLPSAHIELAISDTDWDMQASKAVDGKIVISADVAGEDQHVTQTTVKDGAEKKFEAYVIGGGIAKSEQGGKEFEVKDGKLGPTMGAGLILTTIPLALLGPITVGAQGAKVSAETYEGRSAERYEVDTSRGDAMVIAAVGGMLGVVSVKGSVIVDGETGALLKAVLDYESEIKDPKTRQVVKKAPGHLEVTVTAIGTTKVTLPAQ